MLGVAGRAGGCSQLCQALLIKHNFTHSISIFFFNLFIYLFCTGQPRKAWGAYKQIHEYNAYSKQVAASPEYQPEQRVARRFDSAPRHVFSM